MTGEHHDEFHVGYADGMPPGLARFVRRAVVGLLLLAAVLGAALALLLEPFDEGVFEYGLVHDHEGELLIDPHPRLLTADGPAEGYLLVGVGKHGLHVKDESSPSGPPGRSGKTGLSGTLIRSPEAAMLEVHALELPAGTAQAGPSDRGQRGRALSPPPERPAGTAQARPGAGAGAPAGQATNTPPLASESEGPGSEAVPAPDAATSVDRVSGHARGAPESETPMTEVNGSLQNRQVRAGTVPDARERRAPASSRREAPDFGMVPGGHTLQGEIVDTKCYLGAMKPGRGKPHRGCASLCIRGGIPAALLVRTTSGERRLVHLLDRRGQPLGRQVLEWVGEPVEVAGTLRRRDNRLFLLASSIRPTRAPAPSLVLPGQANPSPNGSSR